MKKRLGTRRRRHRADRSEGYWEKRHRQDISSHRIRRRRREGRREGEEREGQRVQVPAPATQIQQHRSANGEEKGRPPNSRGCWTVPENSIELSNTGKYLIYKAVHKVDFSAEWDLREREKHELIQRQTLHMLGNDIKSGRILKRPTNSLFCSVFFVCSRNHEATLRLQKHKMKRLQDTNNLYFKIQKVYKMHTFISK